MSAAPLAAGTRSSDPFGPASGQVEPLGAFAGSAIDGLSGGERGPAEALRAEDVAAERGGMAGRAGAIKAGVEAVAPVTGPSAEALHAEVAARGFARVPGAAVTALLGPGGAEAALEVFAASWERLETDAHMADGGRYRRRRHANFTARAGVPGHARGPHRPHFQALVHNSLNGGVERWFAPVEDAVVEGAPLRALLDLGRGLADALHPGADWFVEAHQFRIEAAAGAPGFPTPEGVHHDGVDVVLIAMIARRNLDGGQTVVAEADGAELARFVLTDRLDTALLDDRRVRHGVSQVRPADPALPSCRDVLVLTWKRGSPPPA